MRVRARANSPLCAPDIHGVAPTLPPPEGNQEPSTTRGDNLDYPKAAGTGRPVSIPTPGRRIFRTEERKINLYRLVPHTGTSTEHHHHTQGAGTVCEFLLGTKAPRGFASEDDQR